MWFEVTYAVNEFDKTDLVYASHYKTQATSGAELVADFYLKGLANEEMPTDTYSRVISIKRAVPCDTARVDLTIDDARYINQVLFKAEPEGSDAIRAIIKKAVDASWSSTPLLD